MIILLDNGETSVDEFEVLGVFEIAERWPLPLAYEEALTNEEIIDHLKKAGYIRDIPYFQVSIYRSWQHSTTLIIKPIGGTLDITPYF